MQLPQWTPLPEFHQYAAAVALAALIAALIAGPSMPSRPRPIAADPFDARAAVSMPAKGVRVVPIYQKITEPEPVTTTPTPTLDVPIAPLAPAEPPRPVGPEKPVQRSVADAEPARHVRDGDICARHGMHRVTIGRGWRCRK